MIKAGIWFPVAEQKYSGFFFFLIACLLLFYFIFGIVTKPELTTSACSFSGVRLYDSGGEASKSPSYF